MFRFANFHFLITLMCVASLIFVLGLLSKTQDDLALAGLVLDAQATEIEDATKSLGARPVVLHAILRPDEDGKWYVQEDEGHAAYGIDRYVGQDSDGLKVFTCCGNAPSKAGVVHITSDDGFGTRVTGHASLGVNVVRIEVHVDGRRIDPETVWDYLPYGNGNFWITVLYQPGLKPD